MKQLVFLLLISLVLAAETRRCTNCLKVVYTLMPKNVKSTKTAVESLDNVCSKLPKNVRDQCRKYILDHETEIKKLANENLLGERLCTDLRLCSKSSFPELVDTKVCNACLRTAKKTLPSDPKNFERLEKDFKKTCKRLPSRFKKLCQEFLENNAPKLMELNKEGLLGREVCEKVHACFTKPCYGCVEAVKALKKHLPHNINAEVIKKTANTACKNFAEQYGVSQQNCLNFIDKMADTYVLTQHEKHPEYIICTKELGLCKE
ncbi:hypothetical protein P9112_004338 [Eukaryota sp. TZLM1-RC]